MKKAALAALLVFGGLHTTFAQRPSDPALLVPQTAPPLEYIAVADPIVLPAGMTMGAAASVAFDAKGHLFVLNRGAQPFVEFDENGKFLRAFGDGLFTRSHGLRIDADGNLWATDVGAHVVMKLDPQGRVLLTLGTKGEAGEWNEAAGSRKLNQPNDVAIARNGDIFVSEGHGAGNNRVLKFDKTGKFIKEWGKLGTGPGEFDQPHALAMDSQGRLFVGDRNNNRVQVFDQDGKYITEYKQFSRPSGIFIKGDTLYVADSESESVSQNHNGWHRGIRYGSIKTGKIGGFIPDPETRTRAADNFTGTSAAEGVAVDAAGNIYGAEVGPKAVKKYVKK